MIIIPNGIATIVQDGEIVKGAGRSGVKEIHNANESG